MQISNSSAEGIKVFEGDFNNFINYNYYFINYSFINNRPIDSCGKLFVEEMEYGLRQIFFPDSLNHIYMRNKYPLDNSGIWSNWTLVYPCYPITGGKLHGSTILRNVNNSNLNISAGTAGNTTSANLNLFGKDELTYPGYFFLTASNGMDIKELIGRPNGTLTWNNNFLSDIAITSKSIKESGYISFACGLIFQWMHTNVPLDNVITNIKEKLVEYSLNISPVNEALPLAIYGNTSNYTVSVASIANNGGNKNKVVVRYHSLEINEIISAGTIIFAVCF